MKILKLNLLLLFIGFVACSENDQTLDKSQVESQAVSIETQIEEIHDMFLLVKESTPNAVLQFSMEDGKLVSKIENLEDQDYAQARVSDKLLCKGGGAGFAKCVKKALGKNECIRIVHNT